MKFYFFQAFLICTEFYRIFKKTEQLQRNLHWIGLFSALVGRYKHLQHAMYLDLLASKLAIIKYELFVMNKNGKVNHNEEETVIKLMHAKKAYAILFELKSDLEKIIKEIKEKSLLFQNFVD